MFEGGGSDSEFWEAYQTCQQQFGASATLIALDTEDKYNSFVGHRRLESYRSITDRI